MTNVFYIQKAQPTGGVPVENVEIHIKNEAKRLDDLSELAKFYESQGEYLENALYNSLPGGSYASLLVAMLKRRASMFIVSFGEPELKTKNRR